MRCLFLTFYYTSRFFLYLWFIKKEREKECHCYCKNERHDCCALLHRLLHTSHPFPCTECGEAFKRRKELDLHSLMHQGKSLTFIAHRCSSRRDDTHDAPTAVVRGLIYLQQKLNICLLLICGCLHLHMMYVVDLMPGGLQSYGDKCLSIISCRRRVMIMMKKK